MESEARWELVPEDDYIFSGIPTGVLVGFLEFADDTWCVCLRGEDSSVSEVSGLSDLRLLPDEDWDLDEIPF